MYFSLIIPHSSVNFCVLRYFEDYSNEGYVKQGPAVLLTILSITNQLIPVRFWKCFWSNTPNESKDTSIKK